MRKTRKAANAEKPGMALQEIVCRNEKRSGHFSYIILRIDRGVEHILLWLTLS